MLLIKDIGEQGLLQKLHKYCPTDIIGDDAAVISTSADKKLVVTTDVLVENVHFSDATTSAYAVGWRASTANLSDIASMGGNPIGITVGLALRDDVTVKWVEELYQGMKDCLDQYNTPILGGDVCKSSVVTVAITALGEVDSKQVITRNKAQVGYAIVATGLHGLSKAGLELLLHPEIAPNLAPQSRQKLILAHQKPQPRLDVIAKINEMNWHINMAGMDSSDGLADAIIQICRCSGVGAEIQENLITLSPDILEFASSEKALQWALFGGEDFELILCLPFDYAQILISEINSSAQIIGKITENLDIVLLTENTINPKIILSQKQSFQHF